MTTMENVSKRIPLHLRIVLFVAKTYHLYNLSSCIYCYTVGDKGYGGSA